MDNREETKVCQNCKVSFAIDAADFLFYEKIKVPPPTWCPECRMIRRMTWRNERSLYRRKCDAPGHSEDIVAIYPPSETYKVFDREFWWSDKWNAMDYGKEYDFTKSFFQQFKELLDSVPRVNVFNTNAVNSEYGNHNEDSKDCYLLFASIWNEKVSYSSGAVHVKDSFDLYTVEKSEQCYEDVLCAGLYKTHFSYDSDESVDSAFLKGCRNIINSLGCVNLRSKTNHIFNQPYTREDYEKERAKIDLGSYVALTQFRERFREFALKFPRKYASLIKTTNVVGDMVMNTKNCFQCFDIYEGAEDCRYVAHGGWNLKDTFDGYGLGLGELMYEVIDNGISSSRVYFVVVGRGGHDVAYGFNCHGSDNIFGCVGLRQKQYCILNRQYTKEEYGELVPKIIKHMNDMPYIDSKGRVYKYGEFFPPELSPFAYNETIAQEYFPLTKEQAIEQGYKWKDPEPRNYQIQIKNHELPDHIKDVGEDIINKVIECGHASIYGSRTSIDCNEQCTEAFKIIPQELEFLRKMNLPIPRLCPNCRHYQRIKQRNPLKLWHRKCTCGGQASENGVYQNTIVHKHGQNHCPEEFETSYAPERKEIVYCEQCYNNEVV